MSKKQTREVMGETPPKAMPAPDRTDNMSFLEHLEELRWRLIKGIGGILLGVIIAAIFSDFIIDVIFFEKFLLFSKGLLSAVFFFSSLKDFF